MRLLLRRLLPPEDRRVLESELDELHERRVRRDGRARAEGRLKREWLWALWHVSIERLARRVGGTENERAFHTEEATMWTELRTDVRDVGRSLRRRPGFAALVALTLGIGVGSAGAVFAMANQLLLRPHPGITDPDGVAVLEFNSAEQDGVGLSGPDAEALRRSATLLEGFATYDGMGQHASVVGARPVEVEAYTVYGDYFELLGVRPVVGRLLGAEETGPDADPFVAVISESLWERLFGRDPDVVGRQLQMRGYNVTVLGVAEDFTGTEASMPIHLWVPRSAFVPLEGFPEERLWSRDSRLNQWFVVRPREGVALAAAEAELNAILARLAEGDAEHGEFLGGLKATLHPGLLRPFTRERIQDTLTILTGAAALLLLITCANVANLLLVRGAHRRGEGAVRRALGASAARMTRRHLLESLLLGTLGTLAGLGVAWLISLMFVDVTLFGLPGFEGFRLDVRVLGFAAAAVVATTLLSGALPAMLGGRVDPANALRDASTQSTGRHRLLRHGASTLQVALSLTLLVGSVLLTRTVRNLYSVDPGLELEGVSALTFGMERDLPEVPELEARHRALLGAVRGVPGVQSAALHSSYGPYTFRLTMRVARPGVAGAEADPAAYWVTPGWFEMFGATLALGRTFQEQDWVAASPTPVIVTAAVAERLFGHTRVVGETIEIGRATDPKPAMIVGVVGDLRLVDVRWEPDEALFVPYPTERAALSTLTILYRSAGGDAQVGREVQAAVESVVPNLPVPAPAPLTDRIDAQLVEQRIFARLLGLLSILAVLVSAVGLYAVIAFAAAGRKREFAVRQALGADRGRIEALVFRSAAGIVAVGTTIGLAGAYALSRILESRLFGVEAVDPMSYAGAAALFAAVAALACWLPARIASTTDPATTLRRE